MEEARKGIRFITPHYEELFRIHDGGKIRITWRDGQTTRDGTCRYIDEYHMETSSRKLYHICEFAEIAENRGATVTPLSSVMQKGERTPIASWNRAYSGKAEDIPSNT